MLSRTVVIADYRERIIPTFPMMGIDDFCGRWNVTLTDISRIVGVDYTTILRARDRHRRDGTENRAIWLSLGYTNMVWAHQERRAA
jgi:hypothetical protein